MKQKNLVIAYVSLIILHLLHIIEEVIGKAQFIDSIYKGTFNFLIINLLILIIPIMLLYYIKKGKKLAYLFSYIYAIIMAIDGISHVVTRDSGVYTGIGLILFSIFLVYNLKNATPTTKRKS